MVPGDVAISRALDGFTASIRKGLANPVGQIVAGAFASAAAAGGVTARPEFSSGASRACGVAVPQALAWESGGRTGPLVRSLVVGAGIAVLSVGRTSPGTCFFV